MPTQAQAVLFDVYGTLVEISDPKRPFRELLNLALERNPSLDRKRCARALMSTRTSLRSAASTLGLRLSSHEEASLAEALAADLGGARLYPEAIGVLTHLRNIGVRVGVCSNLAHPYVAPASRLLEPYVDVHVWSCEVGLVKPEREIYLLSAARLGVAPETVLMIGDNLEADVNGPRSAGMSAMLIRREGTVPAARPGMRTLDELVELLAVPSETERPS